MRNQLVHLLLGIGWKVALDIEATDCLTHRALHDRDSTLPSRAKTRRPAERAPIEIKVSVDHVAREVGRKPADDLPFEPQHPLSYWSVGPERTNRLHKSGLAHHQRVQFARGETRRLNPRVYVKRSHGLAPLLKAAKVVGLFRVPARHLIPMV